jgi:hypothetical protein
MRRANTKTKQKTARLNNNTGAKPDNISASMPPALPEVLPKLDRPRY